MIPNFGGCPKEGDKHMREHMFLHIQNRQEHMRKEYSKYVSWVLCHICHAHIFNMPGSHMLISCSREQHIERRIF